MGEPTILHADLDAFFASVEQLLDPTLKGRPVLVGGGIVLAASYEARAYGVYAPMPTRDAKRLCPEAVVVHGHFERYLDLSSQVMAVLEDASPVIEQISIDEAFLDVRGSTHLLGTPSAIARQIRSRVATEVGLPISVGVASTKFLAKIASARAKPRGLVVVAVGTELDFLHPLPVEAMWGVGRVTAAHLHRFGICTIGDLAAVPARALSASLGSGASDRAPLPRLEPRPEGRARRAAGRQCRQPTGIGPWADRLRRAGCGGAGVGRSDRATSTKEGKIGLDPLPSGQIPRAPHRLPESHPPFANFFYSRPG